MPIDPDPEPSNFTPLPPSYAPTFGQRVKDAAAVALDRTKSAFAWAKGKIETIGVPTVSANDVLAEAFDYLEAHKLDAATVFNHWRASVSIASRIANDAGHVATKAVAGMSRARQVFLIACAVEEVMQYLAKHGLAGCHDEDADAPPVTVIAGKIEPTPDGGPERAA